MQPIQEGSEKSGKKAYKVRNMSNPTKKNIWIQRRGPEGEEQPQPYEGLHQRTKARKGASKRKRPG